MYSSDHIYQTILDGTWAKEDCYNPEGDIPYENSTAYANKFFENQTSSPVEQYWK